MGKIYQVYVKGPNGQQITIDMAETEEQFQSMTVKQLKEKVALKFPESNGVENMRLMFLISLDEDEKRLSEYGVVEKSLLFVVVKLPGGLTE